MKSGNKEWGVWEKISKLILNNRFLILAVLTLLTSVWINQWKNIRFTFTEANLLQINMKKIYDIKIRKSFW